MADNYKFTITGSDKTRAMFKSLKANLGNLRGALNSTAGKVAGLAGGAGLGLLINSTITANSETTRLAKSLRVSTQALSEWQYAGSKVNLEGDKMADIFKDVSDKIGDFATTGGGGAADMFEQLNLDVKDLVKLSPDQQLLKIGEAMESVGSQSEKVFFMEALAGDASRLLPLLENNAEGLRALQQEARELGVSLDSVDAAKMEQARLSMERVHAVGQGISNQLTVSLAPIIEELANSFVEAAKAGGGMGAMVEKAFRGGVKVVGVFADGIHGIKIIFQSLMTLGQGLFAAWITGFTKVIEIVGSVANGIVDDIVWPIRKVLELLAPFNDGAANALASVDALVEKIRITAPEGMKQFAAAQREALEESRAKLNELLMTELPSDVLKSRVNEILAAAQIRAEEIAATAEQKAGLPGVAANDEGDGTGKGADGLTSKERDALAARLETLKMSWLSEAEQLQVQHDEEMALLDSAFAEKLLKQDEYERSLTELEKKHKKEREAIEQATGKSKLALFTDGAKQLLSAAGTQNKKMAALQMGMAIFTAGTAMVQNIAEASKIGFPQNIPMIAGATAQGIQIANQLQSIKEPAGIAHGGLDYVPKESTYLLDEGERVLSPRQNKDLTGALKNGGMGNVTVNLIEDRSKAGQVERERLNGEDVVRVFVANIREGGDAATALENTYGLQRAGSF